MRQRIQNFYVRVCEDSRFKVDWLTAACLTASAFKIHPIQVWIAVGTVDTMEEIALGKHPVCL
jgi:hypothetical protein